MEPHSFGRKLGIGVRVASRIAQQRVAESQPKVETQQAVRRSVEEKAKSFGSNSKRVAEGSRRFGKSFLGRLFHVVSVLMLEITGVFFALFAAFFLQNVWKVRASYAAGPDHQKFLLFSALSLIFVYFFISSFFRARKKEKRNQN